MSILGNEKPGMFNILQVTSRAAADVASLIAAPGANKAIVITGVYYHIETAEATKAVTIKDGAGTPVVCYVIPLTTAGATGFIPMNWKATVNDLIQLDTDGTTGKWSLIVYYYISPMN